MTELTIVDIYWTERTKLQYDAQKQTYIPPGNGDMDGNGFYCVYGRHPVYGPDVLLYIGETKETESGRSFRDRLGEHLKGRFWYHANLSVALGTPRLQPETHATRNPFRRVDLSRCSQTSSEPRAYRLRNGRF